jgi:hypothetical protein
MQVKIFRGYMRIKTLKFQARTRDSRPPIDSKSFVHYSTVRHWAFGFDSSICSFFCMGIHADRAPTFKCCLFVCSASPPCHLDTLPPPPSGRVVHPGSEPASQLCATHRPPRSDSTGIVDPGEGLESHDRNAMRRGRISTLANCEEAEGDAKRQN